jgi:hypothetical protein
MVNNCPKWHRGVALAVGYFLGFLIGWFASSASVSDWQDSAAASAARAPRGRHSSRATVSAEGQEVLDDFAAK